MRQAIVQLQGRREQGEHAGLLLQRYLTVPVKDNNHPAERRELLGAARKAVQNAKPLYEAAFARWKSSVDHEPCVVTADLSTPNYGRLIVGLGAQNVLETGLRLHHTYGTPLLPGSALKGLAAHYCGRVWGVTDEKFQREGEYHSLLFGTTEDGGAVVFHDAWITPDTLEKSLQLDVITPHHPDWQEGKKAPTDFDSPNPITYLSVSGTFHVVLSWRAQKSEEAEKWVKLAMELLKEALREWGIGGKTSSGYGRLIELTSSRSGAVTQPSRTQKRPFGTPARVRILAQRPKGGFEVQEEGFPQGTLTLGAPPTSPPPIGSVVDVFVHNDDPKRPQYRWNSEMKK